VSERFIEMLRSNNLKGIEFDPVMGSGKQLRQLNYYQIRPSYSVAFGVIFCKSKISCKLFAVLNNFSELCNEVVHICDNRT
jgi:hypothetical protein